MNVIELDGFVSLIHISKEEKEKIFYDLMRILFFEKNTFYSLTETHDETSLIIDSCHDKIFKNCQIIDKYKVIQIFENEYSNGIDHIGIVAKISTLFAANKIPILYINSFNNNYILIKENDYKDAMHLLQDLDSKETPKEKRGLVPLEYQSSGQINCS